MARSWNTARKVLAVRLDALGDVLMTTPALRALAGGGRQVSLLTSAAGARLRGLVPEVAEFIEFESPWMKASAERASAELDQQLIARLRREQFDAAVIFTVFSQNPLPAAYLCWLAEIPLRVAYCRENPYQLLTDWIPEPDSPQQMRHEVQRQLDLVGRVGFSTADEQLSLVPTPEARYWARQLKTDLKLYDQNWILCHPGASAPSRRYPPEKFAAALSELGRLHRLNVVFTGSTAEVELVEQIQSQLSFETHSLAGRLQLAELAAFIELAPLLLTNNTGPAHIAAAVQTPVVDLYALTNPQHTPWQVPSRVLFHDTPCRNCFKSVCPEGHHACLQNVTPPQVAQAVIDLLTETTPQPASLPIEAEACTP